MARPRRLWDWMWRHGWRRRFAVAGGTALLLGTLIGLLVRRAGLYIAEAGWVLIGVAFIWYLVTSVRDGVRKAMYAARPVARFVASVTALAFIAGFPLLVVVLATPSGGNGSAIAALIRNQGSSSIAGEVGGVFVLAVPALVVAVPEILRRRLPWDGTADRAGELVSAWLAVGAAIATWAYLFLLRFGGQALSGQESLNTLAVAAVAIGVAVLLAPLYRIVARSCWKHGIAVIFDPGPDGLCRKTVCEVRCAFVSRAAIQTAHRSATDALADAGPQECSPPPGT